MYKNNFSSKFFKGNRARLRQALDVDYSIVVTANGLLQRGADSTFPFSQDANFWYLTGVNDPDVILVINGEEEYFIVPDRETSRMVFDGQVDAEAIAKTSGISQIYGLKDGWEKLKTLLDSSDKIASFSPWPNYIDRYGLYVNPARKRLVAKLKGYKPKLELHNLNPTMANLRTVKQPAEVRAIKAAIDITSSTLGDVLQPETLRQYKYEYELEAAITHGFRSRGAKGHAFEPIVAGGQNACTLHNIANQGQLSKNDLIVVDVGAEVEHYAADITRTVCQSEMSKRQRQIFDAVSQTQSFAISLLKPGVFLKDYEKQVEQFMSGKLLELGLIKKAEHKQIRKYFPHSTSHFLGLDTHDIGNYSAALAPGVVLTVEPGIYVPEEGIGVRIEDDILITQSGNDILSNNLP